MSLLLGQPVTNFVEPKKKHLIGLTKECGLANKPVSLDQQNDPKTQFCCTKSRKIVLFKQGNFWWSSKKVFSVDIYVKSTQTHFVTIHWVWMKLKRIFLRTYRPTGHEKNETSSIRRRRISRMGMKNQFQSTLLTRWEMSKFFRRKFSFVLIKGSWKKLLEKRSNAYRVNFMKSEENHQFWRKHFDLWDWNSVEIFFLNKSFWFKHVY